MRDRTLLGASLVLGFVLIACGGQDDPAPEPPAIDDPAIEEPGGDTGEDTAAGGSDSRELTIATADAAERAGVAADEVSFVSFEQVTWSDGSLGCPEPDMMYTQALVEGYRIVLEADGEQLVYHGALGEDPFYCAEPAEPIDAGA